MLTDLSVNEFLEKTASGAPTPGGGSVAALNGAVAAGLVEMVAKLSSNRDDVSLSAEAIDRMANRAQSLRKRLTDAVDEDARAYDEVIAAFRLPKSTEDEKKVRSAKIQDAFRHAAEIPMNVAAMSAEAAGLAFEAAEKGNPNAVSDAAVAVLNAKSAVVSALCNVKINLSAVKDRTFVEKMRRQAEQIEHDIRKLDERPLLKSRFQLYSG